MEIKNTLNSCDPFLQSVLDGIAQPVQVINADYHILFMNNAAREFSSIGSLDDAVLCHQLLHGLDHPCKGPQRQCPLELVQEAREPVAVVHEHHNGQGVNRFIEVLAAPLVDDKGAFQGIVESLRDITERRSMEGEQTRTVKKLRAALAEIKRLSGLLPICSSCKKIRNDKGGWVQIEAYIRDHSDADFSHGICPKCAKELYPDYYTKLKLV